MALAPILSLYLLMTGYALFTGHAGRVRSFSDYATAGYRTLLGVLVLMMIVLLFARGSATARSERFMPRVLAYVGTFMPNLFVFLGGARVPVAVAYLALMLTQHIPEYADYTRHTKRFIPGVF